MPGVSKVEKTSKIEENKKNKRYLIKMEKKLFAKRELCDKIVIVLKKHF